MKVVRLPLPVVEPPPEFQITLTRDEAEALVHLKVCMMHGNHCTHGEYRNVLIEMADIFYRTYAVRNAKSQVWDSSN